MVLAKATSYWKTLSANKISRVEFPAGPQMLEALNVGSIDLGSTGDIPPIFAQLPGLIWYTWASSHRNPKPK